MSVIFSDNFVKVTSLEEI